MKNKKRKDFEQIPALLELANIYAAVLELKSKRWLYVDVPCPKVVIPQIAMEAVVLASQEALERNDRTGVSSAEYAQDRLWFNAKSLRQHTLRVLRSHQIGVANKEIKRRAKLAFKLLDRSR